MRLVCCTVVGLTTMFMSTVCPASTGVGNFGACCNPGVSAGPGGEFECIETSEAECDALGGFFLGDETDCFVELLGTQNGGGPCDLQPVLGACCLTDAPCQNVSEGECSGLGGVFFAPLLCEDIVNPLNAGGSCGNFGACCLGENTCVNAFEFECIVFGGAFIGDETFCEDEALPSLSGGVVCEDFGACCVDIGCMPMTPESACGLLGGIFQGVGSSCDTVECSADVCPGSGSCFEANGTVGCDDAECCELICDLDPFCCDTEWDGLCADAALNACEETIPGADECEHAAIICPSIVYPGDTFGATSEFLNNGGNFFTDVLQCNSWYGLYDVWFCYRASWTGQVTFVFTGIENPALEWVGAVYDSCDADADDFIACNTTMHGAITINVERGEEYYLRIAALFFGRGKYEVFFIGPDCAPDPNDIDNNGVDDEFDCNEDVNGSGQVNVVDYLLVLNAANGLIPYDEDLDVDGSGEINEEDLYLVGEKLGEDCPENGDATLPDHRRGRISNSRDAVLKLK